MKNFFNLVQGLTTKILCLQHLMFCLLYKVCNGRYACILQTVICSYRELQLINTFKEITVTRPTLAFSTVKLIFFIGVKTESIAIISTGRSSSLLNSDNTYPLPFLRYISASKEASLSNVAITCSGLRTSKDASPWISEPFASFGPFTLIVAVFFPSE